MRTAILGTLRVDALRLTRDRFLMGTALYIVGISVVMRWALPWATEELATRLSFDLRPYYAVLMSHLIVVLASLTGGFVGGFLLLEGREEGTVKAELVAPMPHAVKVALVSGVLIAASVTLTMVEGAIIGMALPPMPALLAIAIAGAPAAPAMALFIASFAKDKVEAFAYTKFCSVGMLIPAGSYFVPEPWQWIAGFYPQYWAAKAYWTAEAGRPGWFLFVLAGLAVNAVWCGLLAKRYLRVVHR